MSDLWTHKYPLIQSASRTAWRSGLKYRGCGKFSHGRRVYGVFIIDAVRG